MNFNKYQIIGVLVQVCNIYVQQHLHQKPEAPPVQALSLQLTFTS